MNHEDHEAVLVHASWVIYGLLTLRLRMCCLQVSAMNHRAYRGYRYEYIFHFLRALRDLRGFISYSAWAAASTSSACPLTFTLRHSCTSLPSALMRKVLRSIPIYSRPYNFFSFITSNCWHRDSSSSDSSSKGNSCFA